MSNWQETPFKALEEAHWMAEKMDLKPTAITSHEGSDYQYFQVKEGRETIVVAQRKDGSGPVRERRQAKPVPRDPTVPRWSDADSLHSGPWHRDEKKTFEEVRQYYIDQFVNPENIEVFDVMLFRVDEDEYEYALDVYGVLWSRVLHKSKHR